MKCRISKAFKFSAAHRLSRVPESHKCATMHGHNFRAELVFEGEPDARGFVADFAEIAIAWEPIGRLLDHRILNEIEGLENPTSEVLAAFVLRMFRAGIPHLPLVLVRLSESEDTYCEVRAEDVPWPSGG